MWMILMFGGAALGVAGRYLETKYSYSWLKILKFLGIILMLAGLIYGGLVFLVLGAID